MTQIDDQTMALIGTFPVCILIFWTFCSVNRDRLIVKLILGVVIAIGFWISLAMIALCMYGNP